MIDGNQDRPILEIPKYISLRRQIRFSETRECTDGLCCFLPESVEEVNKPRSWKLLMVAGEIDRGICLDGILDGDDAVRFQSPNFQKYVDFSIEAIRPACSELYFRYAQNNGTLVLEMGCGIHKKKRDRICETYPQGEHGCSYTLFSAFSLGKCSSRFDGPTEVNFLAVDAHEFAELGLFSYDYLSAGGREYLLLPIPPRCARVPEHMFKRKS